MTTDALACWAHLTFAAIERLVQPSGSYLTAIPGVLADPTSPRLSMAAAWPGAPLRIHALRGHPDDARERFTIQVMVSPIVWRVLSLLGQSNYGLGLVPERIPILDQLLALGLTPEGVETLHAMGALQPYLRAVRESP